MTRRLPRRTDAAPGCQSSDLVRPVQTADTLVLDEPAACAVRERLELHRRAIEVLRGQGRDHSEAFRIVSLLTHDELRTFVRGPASGGHQPTPGSTQCRRTTRMKPLVSTTVLEVPPGYEILCEIGEGGMGVVYLARDCALDRPVALKFLQQRFASDPSAGSRFLDEAQITGRLQHPGIPPVHQVGT